uniref:Uncharacterized protein n=1 Tax=Panagrellus redivivus TaxID=6233 RepID=A0A7E4VE25_PANRE
MRTGQSHVKKLRNLLNLNAHSRISEPNDVNIEQCNQPGVMTNKGVNVKKKMSRTFRSCARGFLRLVDENDENKREQSRTRRKSGRPMRRFETLRQQFRASFGLNHC